SLHSARSRHTGPCGSMPRFYRDVLNQGEVRRGPEGPQRRIDASTPHREKGHAPKRLSGSDREVTDEVSVMRLRWSEDIGSGVITGSSGSHPGAWRAVVFEHSAFSNTIAQG